MLDDDYKLGVIVKVKVHIAEPLKLLSQMKMQLQGVGYTNLCSTIFNIVQLEVSSIAVRSASGYQSLELLAL